MTSLFLQLPPSPNKTPLSSRIPWEHLQNASSRVQDLHIHPQTTTAFLAHHNFECAHDSKQLPCRKNILCVLPHWSSMNRTAKIASFHARYAIHSFCSTAYDRPATASPCPQTIETAAASRQYRLPQIISYQVTSALEPST